MERTIGDSSEPCSPLILTKYEVEPIYIRDPDGSLREITEIVAPSGWRTSEPVPDSITNDSQVERTTEKNAQHEITYEPIPVHDESDHRK